MPILKKTLPFLAIFALTLVVAGTSFIQNYAERARAQAEGVSVNLTNIQAPLNNDSTWKWRVDITANKQIEETMKLTYTVNWCKETTGKQGEGEGRLCTRELTPGEFIRSLVVETQSFTIGTNTFEINHPSVACGRVFIDLEGLNTAIGDDVYDTGTECTDSDITAYDFNDGSLGILATEGSETKIGELVREFLDIFNPLTDISQDGNDTPQEPPPPEEPFPLPTAAPLPPSANQSCPIPGGTIIVGSRDTPVVNDFYGGLIGHCDATYLSKVSNASRNCTPGWGTEYAIDITGGRDVILPSINGESVEWIHMYETPTGDGTQAIQRYGGTAISTDGKETKYWLQFHHSALGDQNITKRGKSGDLGARICSNCNHTHVQLGFGSSRGNARWTDAMNYFCK